MNLEQSFWSKMDNQPLLKLSIDVSEYEKSPILKYTLKNNLEEPKFSGADAKTNRIHFWLSYGSMAEFLLTLPADFPDNCYEIGFRY